MKTAFLHIFTLFLLLACGLEGDRSPAQLNHIGQTLSATRSLSSQESSTALGICYAFRSLWTEFRASKKGESFTFDYEARTCEKNSQGTQEELKMELKTTLVHLLDSAPMVFDSAEMVDYVRNMESHLHGRLSPLCQRLIKGESVSNIYDLSPSEKMKYSFYSDEEYDVYEVAIAEFDNAKEAYIYRDIEVYHVLARTTQQKLKGHVGMVMRSERTRRCQDGTKAFIEQVFRLP